MDSQGLVHRGRTGVGDSGAGQHRKVGGGPQTHRQGGARAAGVEDEHGRRHRDGRDRCQRHRYRPPKPTCVFNRHRTTLPHVALAACFPRAPSFTYHINASNHSNPGSRASYVSYPPAMCDMPKTGRIWRDYRAERHPRAGKGLGQEQRPPDLTRSHPDPVRRGAAGRWGRGRVDGEPRRWSFAASQGWRRHDTPTRAGLAAPTRPTEINDAGPH